MPLLVMPPLLQVVVSVSFMVGLAILLFGAPFVPPFRSVAVDALFILIVLGNTFLAFVIITTIVIYYKSRLEEGVVDPEDEDATIDYEAKLMGQIRKEKSK